MKNKSKESIFHIKDKTYKKTWLDLDAVGNDWADKLNVVVCIGTNSLGKTYSLENRFVKLWLQGKKTCWIRRSQLEAKGAVQGWNECFKDKDRFDNYFKDYVKDTKAKDLSKIFAADALGVWRLKGSKKVEMVCALVYASSPDSSIPQGIEGISEYGFDELLGGNEIERFNMKNPVEFILKMQNRLTRDFQHIKPVLWLLANPHTPESDILSGLKIDLDWKKLYEGKDVIDFDEKRGFLQLLFPTEEGWDNPRLKIQNSRVKEIFGNEAEPYHFPNPAIKNIFVNRAKQFIPWLAFNWDGRENTYMIFRNFKTGYYYIDSWTKKIPKKIKVVSLQLESHSATDVLLIREESIYKEFEFLLTAKIFGDKIWYQSPYIRDEVFKDLIEKVEQCRKKLYNN